MVSRSHLLSSLRDPPAVRHVAVLQEKAGQQDTTKDGRLREWQRVRVWYHKIRWLATDIVDMSFNYYCCTYIYLTRSVYKSFNYHFFILMVVRVGFTTRP